MKGKVAIGDEDIRLEQAYAARKVIEILQARQSEDHLELGKDKRLIEQFGKALKNKDIDTFENPPIIRFSAAVVKINRLGSHQNRVLLLTDRAVYNLVPRTLQVKRRINLQAISSITVSLPPAQHFIIHVKDEYDYLYKSDKRNVTGGLELDMQISELQDLSAKAKTKSLAARQLEVIRKRGESMQLWGIRKARKMVRGKKKHVTTDTGVELDLTYITDRIIAMGFPSENLEGLYRNPYGEVYRHLETKHKSCYKVYNLCSERGYPASKFNNRVGCYPFHDHNPPPFRLLLDICEDIQRYLSENKDNAVAIHCKAGKGRTGTVISAFLIFAGATDSAERALEFFGEMRTKNSQGVRSYIFA